MVLSYIQCDQTYLLSEAGSNNWRKIKSCLYHAIVSAKWLMNWMKRCYFCLYLSRPCPSLLHIWISRGAEFCAHPELDERLRNGNGTWQCDCGYHGLHLHVYFRHCNLTHLPIRGDSQPWLRPSGSSSKAWEELDTLGRTPQEPADLEPV